MTLIDRLVFGQWLRVFALALLSTLGIILLQQMYDKLPNMLEYGASTSEICTYFLVAIPGFLPTILPVALLISVLFSLSHMHRYNETLAMRAAGLHIFRITRSLWAMSVVFSVLLFALNAHWVPWSIERAKHLLQEMRLAGLSQTQDINSVDLIFDLSYENHGSERRWLINRFHEPSYRAYGIHVYQLKNGKEHFRILAQEGFFDDQSEQWTFLNGRRIEIDTTTQEVARSVPFQKHVEESFHDNPYVMQLFSKRPKDLSIQEVRRMMKDFPSTEAELSSPYRVRYLSMLSTPIICIVVVAISIPFAMSGVRTNPMIGLSKAAALFFAYYLLSSLIETLGSQNILPAYIAVGLPILVITAISILLYRKVT